MHRQDGRGPEEFRPACLQQGVLTRAQGSAFVELGRTKVMVGVFGPREHTDQGREPYSSVGRTTVMLVLLHFLADPRWALERREKKFTWHLLSRKQSQAPFCWIDSPSSLWISTVLY
eukprot:jgi/Picre1/30644/NNA_006005.t1